MDVWIFSLKLTGYDIYINKPITRILVFSDKLNFVILGFQPHNFFHYYRSQFAKVWALLIIDEHFSETLKVRDQKANSVER